MSTRSARPPKAFGYLTVMSVVMIVVGLGGFIITLVFTIPGHTKVASSLKSRGVQAQGTVTRCQQGTTDESGTEQPVTCWVRFTPPGGHSVESSLAFKTERVGDGTAMAIVYDPEDTAVVARPSDLGYWNSLVRNSLDVVLLAISAVMVPLGIAGLLLRRFLSRFSLRPVRNLAPRP
ncbi:hypothetical protein G3I60_05660 [Streptomyces sp. SID13666]|uniref:DUF3592 domain-containing protein n=1 Tax=unclassified Streptomyces TaxID=2593676 RepID=UPI0013BED34D|nr:MULTISPECIES: DUF3592 domain-containing protein [unclassified Streptomyces]NEA53653.1 hypothetical protein [Streptomyces sp. SID13666]NEA71431.1 hypothetical protein [Streptomyces sp. SID13588]